MEAFSIAASLVSIFLAGFAIWLSLHFSSRADASDRAIHDATQGLASTVDRIEALFDRFYTDTFSLFQETWTDMRASQFQHQVEGPTATASAPVDGPTSTTGDVAAQEPDDVQEADPSELPLPSGRPLVKQEHMDFVTEAVEAWERSRTPGLTLSTLLRAALKAGLKPDAVVEAARLLVEDGVLHPVEEQWGSRTRLTMSAETAASTRDEARRDAILDLEVPF